MTKEEFREVAHSGGKITIMVATQPDGRKLYRLEFQHCRPVPSGLFAVHVLPPGIQSERRTWAESVLLLTTDLHPVKT